MNANLKAPAGPTSDYKVADLALAAVEQVVGDDLVVVVRGVREGASPVRVAERPDAGNAGAAGDGRGISDTFRVPLLSDNPPARKRHDRDHRCGDRQRDRRSHLR